MTAVLEVHEVDAFYGDFQALFGPSITVEHGETVAVIGANGAGKSTLLRAILGQIRVGAGRIDFLGESLAGVPTPERVRRGIVLVPEGRKLFPSLTVRENLLIGAHTGRPGEWNADTVIDVLPLIAPLLTRAAGKLSGGEQQAVAIGRALMANPELLLLDEVSLGLAPVVVKQIYETMSNLGQAGTTMVVVEQDLGQAMAVADRVYCLLEGRVSLTGRPDEFDNADITAAYFGVA